MNDDGTSGTAKFWDATTGQNLLTFKTKKGFATLSPDGKKLAQAGTVWDTATGKELLNLKGHRGPVTAIAFSPDGRRLVTPGVKTEP